MSLIIEGPNISIDENDVIFKRNPALLIINIKYFIMIDKMTSFSLRFYSKALKKLKLL